MKLITILFFCSSFLPTLSQDYTLEEIDCNHQHAFSAVDAALKSYNDKSESGNQFVLHRITQVNKTNEDNSFFLIFNYDIKEGNCPVHNGKTWQECDYKETPDAATGACTATVRKNSDDEFTVVSQSCRITPGEGPTTTHEYQCLGCMQPISPEDPELEQILRHNIQHFNNHSSHSHLFTHTKILSAQRQVVAGWNYNITYLIQETNCSKTNFLFLTPECQPHSNGDLGECNSEIYVNIEQRIMPTSQKCHIFPEKPLPPPPRMCVGCPKEIPLDTPELKEALDHSIKKFNAENNETFYFKVDEVLTARSQVVAGMKYFIQFKARETTCSKESDIELIENCATSEPERSLHCDAEVVVVPWEKKVYPTVKCISRLSRLIFTKRPPGFSPFRSAINPNSEQKPIVSLPPTSIIPVQDEEKYSGKEQRPNKGHGRGHKKHIKSDLGHKHEHDQGDGHIMGYVFGRGHQKQHGLNHGHQQPPGLDQGQQQEFDYEYQRNHGVGHGHQGDHSSAHGHKHGRGHGKHKTKGKIDRKHKHHGWQTEHFTSSSEDSTISSLQIEKTTEGPTPIISQPQTGEAADLFGFQDSDLFETRQSDITPAPTQNGDHDDDDDDWIPSVQVEEPQSLSFNLISDFPEVTSPQCPGRPWKTVSETNPSTEIQEFQDFDLADALD